MRPCDLLITHALLFDARHGAREDLAIAVVGSRIDAVGPSNALEAKYSAAALVDAREHIVLPGLVNAHTHASATLFRGYAPDVAGPTFFERMWRIESRLTDEDVYVGALGGCVEMIKNGITGFANHFTHMDQVARAVEQAGMRAGLSRTMLDRGAEVAADSEVTEGLEFAERWSGRSPLITPMLGPHSAYTCSDRLLRAAAAGARRTGLSLHMHVAESPFEQRVMQERAQTSTVAHLDRLGFFDQNRIIGAHSLMLSDADLSILRHVDYHAAICTPGKMNRGQGIADIGRLQAAGLNVCLGTDGSASDNLDILMGMKVTHIAQNYLKRQVCTLSPDTVLRLGTANGARALRWELGHLERGELADLILVDRRSPHLCPLISAPCSNVAFNLVYYATGADVDTVIIDGKIVMQGRKLETLDEASILGRLQQHAQRLWTEAGQA